MFYNNERYAENGAPPYHREDFEPYVLRNPLFFLLCYIFFFNFAFICRVVDPDLYGSCIFFFLIFVSFCAPDPSMRPDQYPHILRNTYAPPFIFKEQCSALPRMVRIFWFSFAAFCFPRIHEPSRPLRPLAGPSIRKHSTR